ncbi:hypothetical protein TanjilG_06816 [Lupinus angustifolius]|uniref:Uncharacterized protein n=1 Tax=Lupinus angustifolius TaxID=3871 RepID=A0A1J7H0H3_LUPAN|nr:hypothetical protein TanjilG_06816 [Lupinus angustifolius]
MQLHIRILKAKAPRARIFVGNLDPNVTDDHLRQVFGQSSAEEALRVLNGVPLGGQNVRLSWGRSPSNKQAQPDANQWNGGGGGGSGGYYGYPQQGYENYGYAAPAPAPAQDPNLYGSYPAGYANYQPPQQQQQLGYN